MVLGSTNIYDTYLYGKIHAPAASIDASFINFTDGSVPGSAISGVVTQTSSLVLFDSLIKGRLYVNTDSSFNGNINVGGFANINRLQINDGSINYLYARSINSIKDITGGAKFYYANYVTPNWTKETDTTKWVPTTTIGKHKFGNVVTKPKKKN
jgi:hypothetical protein